MGWFSDKGKEGTWIEGKVSKEHTHKDGSSGRDVYASKSTYREGNKVSEKNAGWGHTHESSSGSGTSSSDSGK